MIDFVSERFSSARMRDAIRELADRLKKMPRMPKAIARPLVRARRVRLVPDASRTIQDSHARRLLVDISVIFRSDSRTGIQRVVRAILAQLQNECLNGIVVQPVVATRKHSYRLATWSPEEAQLGDIVFPARGDVFLGLDLSAHIIPARLLEMARWKAAGVRFYFVIYDLLPLENEEWFSAKLVRAFRKWITAVVILSDGVFCISRVVENAFRSLLKNEYGMRDGEIASETIPVGAHIADSVPSKGLPDGFADVFDKFIGPIVLMVGTVEPRKGHREIFDAFDHLWKIGCRTTLVIVGRPGWKTEALQSSIRAHPQFEHSLFWFDRASDEALERLYQGCSGVVVASKGEGLGLPLLEALSYGKPVLARDLPVFHEIAGEEISYFEQFTDTETLARRIDAWLNTTCKKQTSTKDLNFLPLHSWRDSMECMLAKIYNVTSN
ncbi:glycosyltransferase family 4 protein [Paraburkholderia sp. HD33-4]|uniref:glycosyltransferase family 4 protein n=1 Tax=Paraburkholderia sp. HD33-4 TaxID=2883242 RepID=UPI001F480F72|nr:glycosyltransferase family 1 protein [Paraburkholderia sp. HD33-4]